MRACKSSIPVTEMRFGCDLVCEQLWIASGGKVEQPAAPAARQSNAESTPKIPSVTFVPRREPYFI